MVWKGVVMLVKIADDYVYDLRFFCRDMYVRTPKKVFKAFFCGRTFEDLPYPNMQCARCHYYTRDVTGWVKDLIAHKDMI